MSMKQLGICALLSLPLLFGCAKKDKAPVPKQEQGVSEQGDIDDGEEDVEMGKGKEYRFSGVTLKIKGKPRPAQGDSSTGKSSNKKVGDEKTKGPAGKAGPKLPRPGQLVQ